MEITNVRVRVVEKENSKMRGFASVTLDDMFAVHDIRILEGDNTRVCTKYEVPIDYIDLGSNYSEIETPSYLIQFNQDKLRKVYGDKIDDGKGFPFGIDKKSKEVMYYTPTTKGDENNYIFFSTLLLYLISTDVSGFNEAYEGTTTSVKYTFSQASILASKIPLIVVCAFSEGLEKVMRKAGVKYELSQTRPRIDKNTHDVIRFKDGFLTYQLDYNSSLLTSLEGTDRKKFALDIKNAKNSQESYLNKSKTRKICV